MISVKQALIYGDSASSGNVPLYWLRYASNLGTDLWYWQRIAVGGRTVASAQDAVDTELAAITSTIHAILFNLGKNDADDALVAVDWKADLAYILDAMHTKWPSAIISIMKPWRRDYLTPCNNMVTWIGEVIASRLWCSYGPDERIFLEGGDNGVTYTDDGVHPNATGEVLTGQQWAQYVK